jgi:hypothetical protein
MFICSISFGQIIDSTSQKVDSINCNRIIKEIDEFSGEITYEAKVTNDVIFFKFKDKGIVEYCLSIWVKETDIYTGTGVTIILKNGKKINKPNAKVESTYSGGSFYTTTFIRLTNYDIELLKQSGVEKYKLYVSTGQIIGYSDLSKDIFNCLIKAK